MSIFVHDGRARMAELVYSCPIHLAIGSGGEGVLAAPDYDETALRGEVGRKSLFRGLYVVPDENGVLELPNGKKYSMSVTSTRYLYLQFIFNYGDGDHTAIRELGIFLDTVPKSDLPADQTFFKPHELENPGKLLFLAHLEEAETFNPQKRGMFEIVLSF